MALTFVTYPLRKPLDKIFIDKMPKILERIGGIILADARNRVPKDTSWLHDHIEKYVDVKNNRVVVGSNVSYAYAVEYGTEKMINAHGEHDPRHPVKDWEAKRKRGDRGSGQTMPYLRPAVFFNRAEIKKAVGEELTK